MRGDTAAMIRAGHERARRNLHDTWALRRSQPLVSLGPSGLPPTVRRRRGPGQSASSTVWRRIAPVIHRPSTVGRDRGSVARSGRRPTRRRIERGDLAAEPGQHQPAADQLGRGHHLGMGDPPGDRPVGLDGERLDLGLDERRARAAASRAARRSASPSDAPSAASPVARLEAVGVEPVGDDEQPGACPSGAPAARRG